MTGLKIAGLVLAAGLGRRFQASLKDADVPQSKMLALWQGKPLVRWVAEVAVARGLDPIIMVTGHAGDGVAEAGSGLPLTCLHNPSYADGMASSLVMGLSALPQDCNAVVVLLGDMPRVGTSVIESLCATFQARPNLDAVVPCFQGQRGNPVLLARSVFPKLRSLTGDRGAGPILQDPALQVETVEVGDSAILFDIDTQEALQSAPIT